LFDFVHNIDIWAAISFILGFIFVIIEMFFPGFGLPGVVGLIFLFIGIVLTAKTLTDVLVLLAIILLILAVVLAIAVRSASKGRLKKLVLPILWKRRADLREPKTLRHFSARKEWL